MSENTDSTRYWRMRSGRLRMVPVLSTYFKVVGILGCIGFVSVPWNIFPQPSIAEIVQPIFHIVAILHAIAISLLLMQRLNIEKPPTHIDRQKRIPMTLLMFGLTYVLFANAFMRAVPLISTFVWSSPQQIEAQIVSVHEVRRRKSTCAGRFVFGAKQSQLKIELGDFYWPNRTLCVDAYGWMEISRKSSSTAQGVTLLMPGYGNWLAFRMEQYEVQ